MRTIFYATTVMALIAAAACSDSPATPDAGPGGQICPTTIEQATKTASGSEGTTNKCHVDHYICVVGFQCGNFTQQGTCTCDGSKFSCTLANGDTIQDDVAEADVAGLCKSVNDGGNPNACPTDKTTATGTSCTNAGQECTYTTTCTGNPPPTDECQCQPNAGGDAGLSWVCDLNQCP